ncbi:hypothetical protein E2562_021872 [Oryza meyeriana var. granulata]|uniref:CCHC-type domain-containing protein n=1 Tax=Oryza meyeriana var. granulata TaxID=110450 RepID=A0A6G1C8M2_9ORYZ|nr:hypothetical protein E2562_021872 [Oryza meyeriana var. granulata]
MIVRGASTVALPHPDSENGAVVTGTEEFGGADEEPPPGTATASNKSKPARPSNSGICVRKINLTEMYSGRMPRQGRSMSPSSDRRLQQVGPSTLQVVKKILHVVPKKMKQVAVAIEMLMDPNTMSVEELVGRLRVAEEPRDVDEETGGAGRLLLTEEQWEARRRNGKEHGGKARRGGNARRGGGGDKGSGSHDDDGGGSSTCSGTSGRSERRNRGRCFNYGVRGHLARDCREPKKERALLADAYEETCLL